MAVWKKRWLGRWNWSIHLSFLVNEAQSAPQMALLAQVAKLTISAAWKSKLPWMHRHRRQRVHQLMKCRRSLRAKMGSIFLSGEKHGFHMISWAGWLLWVDFLWEFDLISMIAWCLLKGDRRVGLCNIAVLKEMGMMKKKKFFSPRASVSLRSLHVAALGKRLHRGHSMTAERVGQSMWKLGAIPRRWEVARGLWRYDG